MHGTMSLKSNVLHLYWVTSYIQSRYLQLKVKLLLAGYRRVQRLIEFFVARQFSTLNDQCPIYITR
jgi:hypothetical protein